MPRIKRKSERKGRRSYADEFKQEAVQMLLDGHTAPSVAERLAVSGTNILYRWKREAIGQGGPAARTLDDRSGQVQEELRRAERERDILKKALATLSRHAHRGQRLVYAYWKKFGRRSPSKCTSHDSAKPVDDSSRPIGGDEVLLRSTECQRPKTAGLSATIQRSQLAQ